jgi:hypothetical protein
MTGNYMYRVGFKKLEFCRFLAKKFEEIKNDDFMAKLAFSEVFNARNRFLA